MKIVGIVEQSTKMPRDRQKIQNTGNIQDTNDVVVKKDTRGIANEDTLPMTKKVRWKEMENESQKKFIMKSQVGKQKTIQYKPLKSKTEGLEDAVFESSAVKHAAQFSKMLEEIARYV